MNPETTDNTIQRILEKIIFVATALSSTSVSVAWWATNWFDFGPELAKYVGTRIVKWWRKRSQAADVKSLIGEIKSKLLLDSEQVKMLEHLVDLVRENDDDLRKQIATSKSLHEICVDYLVKMNFNPKKAEHAVDSILEGLREVLTVSVSPTDMYREQMVTRTTAQEILNLQKKVISDTAQIGISIPNSFTPLERRLEYDIVVDAFDKYLADEDDILPQPQFFRRPHLNWIDLMEDFVYTREDVIYKIEDNFKRSNMQLILGDSGAGKTTLAYIFGYRGLIAFRGARYAVYIIDFMNCNPETIQRDIRSILECKAELKHIDKQAISRVLFIFDNIHLNPKWVHPIYEKMRQSKLSIQSDEDTVVDFLFLARPTKDNLTISTEEVTLGIVGSQSARGLLQTIVLEKSQFYKTARGICDRYLESVLSQEEVDLDLLAGKVSRKSKWSLWLVSFVLEAIEKTRQESGSIPMDLTEIDICDSFVQYYIDQLASLEENQEYLRLCRIFLEKDDSRRNFWSLIVLLSIFNRIDFSVPENLVHKIFTNLKDIEYNKEFINLIRDMLIERGELVRADYDGSLSFPHTTLAEQMYQCSQNASINAAPSTMLFATSLFEFKMNEWCELLLNHGISISLIGKTIQGFLRIASIEEANNLVSWLFKNEDLLLKIISEDKDTFTYFLERAIWFNKEATTDFVVMVLSLDNIPLYYVMALDAFTTGYPFLDNEKVRSVFFERFRKEIDVLDALVGVAFTDLINDDEFLKIVEERIPDIAHHLRETKKPSDVIDVISRFSILTASPEINDAVISRIPDLVMTFRSVDDAPQVISQICHWEALIENEELKPNVLNHVTRLAEMILSEEWWIVRLVGCIEYLRRDEKILHSIYKLLRTSDDALKALSFIYECKEFKENKEIHKISEIRLPDMVSTIKNMEINEILWRVDILKELVDKEGINEALCARIPEFIDCLKEDRYDFYTFGIISVIAKMLNSEELNQAVMEKAYSYRNLLARRKQVA